MLKGNKSILKIIKPLDFLIFAICVFTIVFSVLLVFENNNTTPQVIIDTPEGSYIYALNSNQNLSFDGPLGATKITIKNNEAFFTDSPCTNKTCLFFHPARKNGDWIACLPNQIFLRIEGKDTTPGFDALSH
ncbi:MAG TPA: NusG domain II-containing protein [Treponemataceae bacterium]|nr:NusG domain II-containing protein [Treponemataceae bacterium]